MQPVWPTWIQQHTVAMLHKWRSRNKINTYKDTLHLSDTVREGKRSKKDFFSFGPEIQLFPLVSYFSFLDLSNLAGQNELHWKVNFCWATSAQLSFNRCCHFIAVTFSVRSRPRAFKKKASVSSILCVFQLDVQRPCSVKQKRITKQKSCWNQPKGRQVVRVGCWVLMRRFAQLTRLKLPGESPKVKFPVTKKTSSLIYRYTLSFDHF